MKFDAIELSQQIHLELSKTFFWILIHGGFVDLDPRVGVVSNMPKAPCQRGLSFDLGPFEGCTEVLRG